MPALSPRYRGFPLPFQIVHLYLLRILLQLQPYRYSQAFIFSTSFTRVYTCQLEGDSWSDGCYLHTSSHTCSPACSPGAEVDPVLHYASADQTHLGLPHDPAQREEPATDAASLDVLAAAAAASHPPPPPQQ